MLKDVQPGELLLKTASKQITSTSSSLEAKYKEIKTFAQYCIWIIQRL